MAESLRILILEDNPADAELVQFELEEGGFVFTPKVVMTEEDFVYELEDYCPDLILSDYDLPKYNGALALAEAKRRCPDTPFILVTGAVTEDRAIEILTRGAKDYVLKTRLQQRLVPAVKRAIAEAEEHRARKRAEAELRDAHRTLEKQVQEATGELRKSKERLSLALASSRMGIFEWDIVENRRYWDENVHRMLGTKPENFSGAPEEFFGVIHADDRQTVQTALNKAMEQDLPYETEYRAVWPDGSVHHIATRGKVLRDDAGHPLRITGVCWEITERRRTEERLRRQAELLNLASEAIFMWEFDGAIIYWSDGAARQYGYSSEEAVGRVSHDLLKTKHPQGVHHFTTMLGRDATWIGDLLHVTKDGRAITVESRLQLTQDDLGRQIVLETTHDITERKKAELALEERTRKLEGANRELEASRHFLEIANKSPNLNQLLQGFVAEIQNITGCAAVGIRLRDEEGNIPYLAYRGFSRQFYETESPLSIRTDECMCINVVRGTTDPELPFYTEGGSFYMNGTTRFLATVSEEDKGQTRNVCNKTGYESVALIPIRVDSHILGLIHLADRREDMVPLETVRTLEQAATALGVGAQRASAEEELRRQRELLHVTLASIGDAVIATDAKGGITFMNAVAEALTGWPLRDAAAKPVTEVFNIINESTREVVKSPVTRVLQEGVVVGLANHTLLIRRDGTELPIDDSGAPIRDADGAILGVVLVFRDMTERKQAKEALQTTLERLNTLKGPASRFPGQET